MTIVERSLSDGKLARSLNDLTKSSNHQDLSIIVRWSPQSPWSLYSFDSVQNISMIAKGSDLSTNSQWTLNKRSTNAQGVLIGLINLSMISQRSFNERQICPPRRRDGWEINEHTRISHRNGFWEIVERSLRDRAYFWLLNGHPTISVLCKGLLIYKQNNNNIK